MKVSDEEDNVSLLYSLVISSSAFIQVLVTAFCGFAARRSSMKTVFITLQALSIVGILLYAFAGWPFSSAWAIIFGKALANVNAGALSPAQLSIAPLKSS